MLPGRLRVFAFEVFGLLLSSASDFLFTVLKAPIDDLGGLLQAGVPCSGPSFPSIGSANSS